MSDVIKDLSQYRHNKVSDILARQYIAYYGNAPIVTLPNKPNLRVVSSTTEYEQDQLNMDSYIEWLSTEGIDTSTIIKSNPKIPY